MAEHDEDEGYCAGDEDIVLDERVLLVASEMERIDAIVDPNERLAEARRFVDRLNGGQ